MTASRQLQSKSTQILEPVRPPVLRAVGRRISDERPAFIWLLICYDNEEQHQAFIGDGLDDLNGAENLAEEGIVLSDKRFYDWGSQWQRILDCLPEILDAQLERYQKFLGDEDLSCEYTKLLQEKSFLGSDISSQQYAEMTCQAHNACSTMLLLVEDDDTFSDEEVTFKGI